MPSAATRHLLHCGTQYKRCHHDQLDAASDLVASLRVSAMPT
uniref:Uncharacterized protein n=1 Tax=Arundo donax TaxID=35708 RepID=A0A0A9FA04_ARUDO